MQRPGPALRLGERAVDFVRVDQAGVPFSLYERFCGRPALVLIAPVLDDRAVAVLEALRQAFPPQGVGIAAVRLDRGAPPAGLAAAGPGALPLLADDGVVTAAYTGSRAPVGAALFVLDPRLRIAAILPVEAGAETGAVTAAVRAALDALPNQPARVIGAGAPVLIVPDVVGAETRRRLIEACEATRRGRAIDDHELARRLGDRLQRRVLPEVAQAFRYEASRYEPFKVACHEPPAPGTETDGYVRQPRADASPDGARRRFSVTISLNGGEYEGGALRFPAFGPELYDPLAGTAMVFSAALLYDVLDVVAGRRFAATTFLHG